MLFFVDQKVYDAFNDFELEDLAFLNEWDRHTEQSELWESTLNTRATHQPKTVEDSRRPCIAEASGGKTA